MTLHILPDLEQGTPEWDDQRRGMVTASVVGQLLSTRSYGALDYLCPVAKCEAAVGEPCRSLVKRGGEVGAPIKTPHAERTTLAVTLRNDSPTIVEVADNDTSRGLTAFLTAERITGYTEPTFMNDDMWRGKEDEPRAREVYSQHFAPVTQVGFMVRDDWGFNIGYSPDGLVGEDGLIEVKSRRQKKQLITVLSGDVPPENMAQCQTALLVSGRPWLDFLSYSGGMRLWPKRVYPDARWFEAIVAAGKKFESTAAEWIAAYNEATEGLPMTERAVEMEITV